MRTSQKLIILLIVLAIIAIITLLAVDYKKFWWVALILGVLNIGLIALYRHRRRKKRKLTYIFKLLNKYIPGTKNIYEYKDETDDLVKDINQLSNEDLDFDKSLIDILIANSDDEDDEIILGSKTYVQKDDPKVKKMIEEMIDNINKDKLNNINDKLFLLHSFLIGNDIPLDQNKLAVFDKLDLFKCRREIKSRFPSFTVDEVALFNKKVIPDLVHIIWLHQTSDKLDAIIKQNPIDEDIKLFEEFQKKIDDKFHIYVFDFDKLSHPAKLIFKNSLQTENFAEAMSVMDVVNMDKYKEVSKQVVDYLNKYFINDIFAESYKLYDLFISKQLTVDNMYDLDFIQKFNEMIIYNKEFILPNNPYNITSFINNSLIRLKQVLSPFNERMLNKTDVIRDFLYKVKSTYLNSGYLEYVSYYETINKSKLSENMNNILSNIRWNAFNSSINTLDKIFSVYLDKRIILNDYDKMVLKEGAVIFNIIRSKSTSFYLNKLIDKLYTDL